MPQKGEASKVMQKGSCQGGGVMPGVMHREITPEGAIMHGGSCMRRSRQRVVMSGGVCQGIMPGEITLGVMHEDGVVPGGSCLKGHAWGIMTAAAAVV